MFVAQFITANETLLYLLHRNDTHSEIISKPLCTFLITAIVHLRLLECEFHKSRNFCPLCAPRYSRRREQCQHVEATAPLTVERLQPF